MTARYDAAHPEMDADPKTAYSADHVHWLPGRCWDGRPGARDLNVKPQHGVGSPVSTTVAEPRRLRLMVRPRPGIGRNSAGYAATWPEKRDFGRGAAVIGKPVVLTRAELTG